MLWVGGCDAVYLLYLGIHKMVVLVAGLMVVCCWAAERLGAKPKPGFLCRNTDSYPTSPTYLGETTFLMEQVKTFHFRGLAVALFSSASFLLIAYVDKYCI